VGEVEKVHTSISHSPRSIKRDVGLPGQSVSVTFSFYNMVGTVTVGLLL
jgi:hypothetical protein